MARVTLSAVQALRRQAEAMKAKRPRFDAKALRADPALPFRALGMVPDEKQSEALSGARRQLLLNCSRQWGKSSVMACMATREALLSPGALVLIVSPTERQSVETLRKALGMWAGLGRPVPAL